MKKFLSVVLILSMTLCMGIQASAGDIQEVVQTADLYHVHTGSASGGGCYTSPVYHSHTGSSSGGGGCYTSPVYHSHSGDSSSGGGCYGQANYVTIKHYRCTVDNCCYGWGADTYLCCPHGHGNMFTDDDSKQVVSSYSLNCGKSTSTVERYNLGCGKSTSTVERYNLGCGASDSTLIGTFSITKKVVGSSYTLIPSVAVASGMLGNVTYAWSNGSVGDCSVTANGTYTCTLSYTDNGRSATSVLSYTVSDYDTEAPIISGISVSSERTGSALSCTVNATDNVGVDSYKIESR